LCEVVKATPSAGAGEGEEGEDEASLSATTTATWPDDVIIDEERGFLGSLRKKEKKSMTFVGKKKK